MNFHEDFPVINQMIYLDHASVAPLHKLSKNLLNSYIEYFLLNGNKDYEIWEEKVENTRAKLAKFLNTDSSEIAFVKNTSAGLSILANGINFTDMDNIIVPNNEFPSNIYPWLNLKKKNVETRFLKSKSPHLNLNELADLIDEKTRLVSVSWVNFLSGYKNDLKVISQICKQKSEQYGRKIYFCVDAIQGLGALKLDLQEIEIDFLAADGHKWLLALEGAGIIYCNKKILKEIDPIFVGWKSVKDKLNYTKINFDLDETAAKFEEGSMNIAGILSLDASLDMFEKYGLNNIEKRILDLNKYAFKALEKSGAEIFSTFDDAHRSGILSFKYKNETDKVFKKLSNSKIQLSKRGDLIRISPHFYNSEKEINLFINILES